MKRSMIFLCLILAMCYPAYAAAVPDFGGAWTRDVNESDALATLIEGAVTPVNADLVIKHADGKIEVESVWTHKAPTTKTYILNGTENNAADAQGVTRAGAYVENALTGLDVSFNSQQVATGPFN